MACRALDVQCFGSNAVLRDEGLDNIFDQFFWARIRGSPVRREVKTKNPMALKHSGVHIPDISLCMMYTNGLVGTTSDNCSEAVPLQQVEQADYLRR